MTISAKLSDTGGLEFIVSDPGDTDDVNGFSDSQVTIGGESAKFSGGAAMKANAGKIIGISQVKVNVGRPILNRTIESSSGITNPENLIDDDDGTIITINDVTDTVTIDFGAEITAAVKTNGRKGGVGEFVNIETSTDNISYSLLERVLYPVSEQTLTHGSATFRYVRLTGDGGSGSAVISNVFAEDVTSDDVTFKLLSTAGLDSTSGTDMIGATAVIPTSRDLGSSDVVLTFNSVLYRTEAGHHVTLQVVSYAGVFNVPVTLSEITTVREV